MPNDEAKKEGVVCTKKRDVESFYITPAILKKSPLDVKGVDLGITSTAILDAIKESREKKYS